MLVVLLLCHASSIDILGFFIRAIFHQLLASQFFLLIALSCGSAASGLIERCIGSDSRVLNLLLVLLFQVVLYIGVCLSQLL